MLPWLVSRNTAWLLFLVPFHSCYCELQIGVKPTRYSVSRAHRIRAQFVYVIALLSLLERFYFVVAPADHFSMRCDGNNEMQQGVNSFRVLTAF